MSGCASLARTLPLNVTVPLFAVTSIAAGVRTLRTSSTRTRAINAASETDSSTRLFASSAAPFAWFSLLRA